MLMSGCGGDEKSASPFAEFKWGFTTQNFAGHVPVSPETAKEFINYAKEQGLQWIELRDPNASLSVEQCREIATFAKEQRIEVNYSAQRGLLADDFWEIFGRAVANTAVFDGLRTVRVLALRRKDEQGWTKEEFARAVAVANEAADRAAAQGIRFTVENADVALDGRGRPYYGMTELLEATSPNVLLQLDTANLFTGPVPVTPQQAEEFIRKYATRISYLHLKSARDGKALPVLEGNPLDFKTILSMLADHGTQYIAIELSPGGTAEQVYANMKAGMDDLRTEGLLY